MKIRFLLLIEYFLKILWSKAFHRSEKTYDLVYQAVWELGGLYVKLVQFVCLNTLVFPESVRIRFLSFYDEVKPEPLDLSSLLVKELGASKLKQISHIENKPFAAGSFAQVYKAWLINGQEVVIKIQRSNLKSQLRTDFFILGILGRIFDLFYNQKLVQIPSLITEFKDISYKELNYREEVRNALYFFKLYQNHPKIHIPKTYQNLCSERVIVQDFVGGVALTELIKLKDQSLEKYQNYLKNIGTDMKSIMCSIYHEILYQGMVNDCFYADPHPGNIKVLNDNRLAFIDFGILGKTPKNKRTYYQIFKLMIQNSDDLDMGNLGQEFLAMGANYFYKCLKVFDYYLLGGKGSISQYIFESYQRILNENREKYKEIEIHQEENLTEMVIKTMQLGERFGVMLPSELLAVMRSVVIFKSYHGILEPDHHPIRGIIKQVLEEVDSTKLINYEDLETIGIPVEEAIETVLDKMSEVAEVDMPLYQKLSLLIQRSLLYA